MLADTHHVLCTPLSLPQFWDSGEDKISQGKTTKTQSRQIYEDWDSEVEAAALNRQE